MVNCNCLSILIAILCIIFTLLLVMHLNKLYIVVSSAVQSDWHRPADDAHRNTTHPVWYIYIYMYIICNEKRTGGSFTSLAS